MYRLMNPYLPSAEDVSTREMITAESYLEILEEYANGEGITDYIAQEILIRTVHDFHRSYQPNSPEQTFEFELYDRVRRRYVAELHRFQRVYNRNIGYYMEDLLPWGGQERDLRRSLTDDEIRAAAREYRQNDQAKQTQPPESVCSSDEDETDVPEDLQCDLCEREIKFQFKGCAHAACAACVKGLWWSRYEHDEYPPSWLKCPWCREEISGIGILDKTLESEGDEIVKHGNTKLKIVKWENLLEWIKLNSKRWLLRSEYKADVSDDEHDEDEEYGVSGDEYGVSDDEFGTLDSEDGIGGSEDGEEYNREPLTYEEFLSRRFRVIVLSLDFDGDDMRIFH